MILEPNPLASLPQYSDEELAEFNREFEHLPEHVAARGQVRADHVVLDPGGIMRDDTPHADEQAVGPELDELLFAA